MLLVVGMLFLVVIAAVLASRATFMRGSNPLGPEASLRRAVAEALLFAPRGGPRLWVMGVAVLVGALTILVRFRGQRWVVAALGISAALYVAVSGVDSTSTRWLTWPWYNNPPRLAALMVVPATVVAATSLVVVVELVARASWAKRGPSWWVAVLVSSMLLVVTSGGYVSAHRAFIDRYFNPSGASSWASHDELNALRRLARYIGPNDVVAGNTPGSMGSQAQRRFARLRRPVPIVSSSLNAALRADQSPSVRPFRAGLASCMSSGTDRGKVAGCEEGYLTSP